MSRRRAKGRTRAEAAAATRDAGPCTDASSPPPLVTLKDYLSRSLRRDGFGGLWNRDLRCTCRRERPMPCDAARCDCILVYWWSCEGCPEASEDDSGCEYEGGGINFAPNTGCLRDGPQK